MTQNDHANTEVSREPVKEAQSEAPGVVTPQDIRDIFNRYGMNYSQIVGEENTVVSASLYTYNKAIDEIVAKINRLIVEAQQEAIDYFAWRIDCSTVISELYGWKGCVDTAKDQTERHFELSNNLSKEQLGEK